MPDRSRSRSRPPLAVLSIVIAGGERITGDRQEVAGVRIDHDRRGVSGGGSRGVLREDVRHRRLERRVDRERDIALASQERLHVRMIGRVAVAKERNQLSIVSPNRGDRLPGSLAHLDRRRVIVEPAKVVLRIALDICRVGRGPIAPVSDIAQEMKRGATKRVAPFRD